MKAETPRRVPLEPFVPAVVGVALAHVLLGMCVWIVLPLLPQRAKPMAAQTGEWTWFSPSDFLVESQPKQPEVAPQPLVTAPLPTLKTLPPGRTMTAPVGPVIPPNGSLISRPLAPVPSPLAFLSPTLREASAQRLVIPSLVPVISPQVPLLPAPMKPSTASAEIAKSKVPNAAAVKTPPTSTVVEALKPSLKVNEKEKVPVLPPPTKEAPGDCTSASQQAVPEISTLASQASISSSAALAEPTAPAVGTGRAANKYITLSFINEGLSALGTKPVLNLLDIAKLNEATRADQVVGSGGLDDVEEALQQALMREWQPPLIDVVPLSQRRAVVELVILRDGTLRGAYLQRPSGSEAMDASVRALLSRVTKIAKTLPSSFPKERYPVRVNLLIE